MLLNVATLFLGLLGLEAHIRGVSARPHISLGRTGHKKRQDISLSNTSSCNDVEYYQTQNGLTRIQADMYDLLNAQSLLDTYLREKAENTELADSVDSLLGAVDGLVPLPDDFSDIGNTFLFDDYVSGFAAPYGVGQTFSCRIPDTCPRINCADLQDPDAPGTGAAYAILVSFANFNGYIEDLWEALNLSKDDWNGVQVLLQDTYYPYDPPPILLRQLVNGLQAVVGVIGASSGIIGAPTAATVGSGAAVLTGVLGGINLAIASTDESLAQLAELEADTQVWYQTIFDAFMNMNNNLTSTGFFVGDGVSTSLAAIISGGAWVDYTDHPVLNDDAGKAQVSISDLKQAFYYYLIGNMINYAWKAQGAFVVKYEMSEDDFNSKGDDWKPGNGDFRFRTWIDGHAYFLQRYTGDQDPLRELPMSAYPPGWGETDRDLNGCDPRCIMASAAAGFNAHGYNFNFTVDAEEYTKDQSTALGWLTDLPRAPGFFNIPIVDLTGNDAAEDADALNELLLDQNSSYGESNQKTLWCYVQDFTDMNGVKFVDQFDPELVAEFWSNCELGFD